MCVHLVQLDEMVFHYRSELIMVCSVVQRNGAKLFVVGTGASLVCQFKSAILHILAAIIASESPLFMSFSCMYG